MPLFKRTPIDETFIPVVRPHTPAALAEDGDESLSLARDLIAEASALYSESIDLAERDAETHRRRAAELHALANDADAKAFEVIDKRQSLPVF